MLLVFRRVGFFSDSPPRYKQIFSLFLQVLVRYYSINSAVHLLIHREVRWFLTHNRISSVSQAVSEIWSSWSLVLQSEKITPFFVFDECLNSTESKPHRTVWDKTCSEHNKRHTNTTQPTVPVTKRIFMVSNPCSKAKSWSGRNCFNQLLIIHRIIKHSIGESIKRCQHYRSLATTEFHKSGDNISCWLPTWLPPE